MLRASSPFSQPSRNYSTGEYVAPFNFAQGATATAVASSARVYFLPFVLGACTIDTVEVFQVTAAAGTTPAPVARGGLYANDAATNKPVLSATGRLWNASSTLDLTAGGSNAYRSLGTASLAFGGGIIWAAIAYNLPTVGVTMHTPRTCLVATTFLPTPTGITAGSANGVLYSTDGDFTGGMPTSGALTLRGPGAGGITCPILYLKIA